MQVVTRRARRGTVGRPALRLARLQARVVERDRPRARPADDRDRRGPDEPRRRGADRDREGPRARPRNRRGRARERRVLPVRRRPAARPRRGRRRADPAGRLEAATARPWRRSRRPAQRWSSPAGGTSATDGRHRLSSDRPRRRRLGVRPAHGARARGRTGLDRDAGDERLLHRADPDGGRPRHRDRLPARQFCDRADRGPRRRARRLARRRAAAGSARRARLRDADPRHRAADRPGARAADPGVPRRGRHRAHERAHLLPAALRWWA